MLAVIQQNCVRKTFKNQINYYCLVNLFDQIWLVFFNSLNNQMFLTQAV